MKYEHIGWCKDEKTNTDKVWGVILLAEDVPVKRVPGVVAWPFGTNKYVSFWGRRGSKLRTKLWDGEEEDANELFLQKQRDGYCSVEEWELDEVYPEFQQDLEKTAFWATLKI
jgi:hypothetical protein